MTVKKGKEKRKKEIDFLDILADITTPIYNDILGFDPVGEEHLLCCAAQALNDELREIEEYQRIHGKKRSFKEYHDVLIDALIDGYANYNGIAQQDSFLNTKDEIRGYLNRCEDPYADRARKLRNMFPGKSWRPAPEENQEEPKAPERYLVDPERMAQIISSLIEILRSSGMTEEQIRDDLNDIESELTQGDPRQGLTPEEEVLLFGEY